GTNKTVYLGKFAAYNSAKDPQVEDLIFLNLKKELTDSGYTVREGEADLSGTPIEEKSLEKNSHSFLIDGYYRKDKFHNLNLYIQIYDASTGKVIDAVNISRDLPELEDLNLDETELKESDSEVISDAAKKTLIRIKGNPDKKIIDEHIDNEIKNHPISSTYRFPLSEANLTQKTEEVFKLLGETEVVTASRTKESIIDVPASIMVVSEQDFKDRGYSSMEDIFRDLPGFDFIGLGGADPNVLYQRGYRTPFTSRTLLMIDGIIQNDLWTQVATVDRTYPISNVKRVEIIYGPASAVYGPNAFQGIINIITKTAKDNGKQTVAGKTSFMYGTGPNWTVDGAVNAQVGEVGISMSARTTQGLDENNNIKGKGYQSPFYMNNPKVWGPVLFYGNMGNAYGTYKDAVNDWGTILSVTYKTLKIGAHISNKDEAYAGAYPGDKAQTNDPWSKHLVNLYVENVAEITPRLTSYSLALYRDTYTYGSWSEADGYSLTEPSYISITRWTNASKSARINQNLEYKVNEYLKVMGGIKLEFKKLSKYYDIPGYWWSSTYFSSVDALNPAVNPGIKDDPLHQNGGYSIYLSSDPFILKGPSPKKRMPDENTIATYDRGGFLLTIIDWGKFRFSPGVRYDENSVYGRALNPRITGIYKMNDRTAVKLLYGEAFNEPPPMLLYGGFSGRTADLNLKPEKEKTTELIFMRQGKRISNEVSGYYARYEDVIKESAKNAGRRRIYGLEYKFRWNFSNFIDKSAPISLYTYYTYTEALADTYYDHNMGEWKEGVTPLRQYEYLFRGQKVAGPFGSYYDGPASFIPRKREYKNLGDIAPHKINLGANLPIQDLFILNLRTNYVSAREFYSRNALSDNGPLKDPTDVDAVLKRIVQQETKRLPANLIFDSGITMNFKHYGYFTFRVMNIFNTYYVHPGTSNANAGTYYYARSSGYDSSLLPQPGRSFMMNLTLTF
ncbi:MAG: TonB-dependent receptor, partial [Leptospiraceae bacterium]|nr:TonB-dependent receptor [Leptospiraceae bacterium]